MAKKVLYLGGGKWCWTESCTKHAGIIKSKNAFVAATISNDTTALEAAKTELMSTPEGLSTYRYLATQQLTKELGRRPTIGLDLDGTTGDFTSQLRTYMGTSLKIPQSEWATHFPNPDEYAMWTGTNPWYRDKDHFISSFQAAEKEGLYRQVPVYANASKVLHELRDYGFNIKVITARGAEFNDDTRYWTTTHNIPIKKILNPGMAKETVKDIDVYLDDAPHVINTLIQHEKKVVVMEHEYNEHTVPVHKNARRTKEWNDNVVNAIFDLLKK